MKLSLILSVLLIAGFAFAANDIPVLSETADGSIPVITSSPAPEIPLTVYHLQYDDGTGESGLGCGSAPSRFGVRMTPPVTNPPFRRGIIKLSYWINTNYYLSTIPAEMWWDVNPVWNFNPDLFAPWRSTTVTALPTYTWLTATITTWWVNQQADFMIDGFSTPSGYIYWGRDTTAPAAARSYLQSATCGGAGNYQLWKTVTSIGFSGDFLIRCDIDDTVPVELFSFSATSN